MKLNHGIYEEAMENVRLSDETGMRLLEQASARRRQRGQKWKVRMAAIVAAILTVGISLNGICYAQTGKNALEMFLAIFQGGDMEGIEALAEEARESGESITDENLRFTLEYYWYDKENMEAFYAIRVDSLDGTPLDMEAVRDGYYALPDAYCSSALNAGSKESEDKTSSLEYYHTEGAYDESGNPPDNMKIKIWKYQEVIGFFEMEPTGQAKARYADCSALGWDSLRITGAGLKIRLDAAWDEDNKPFQILDVVMKNGTVYRTDHTNHLPYTAEEQEQQEEAGIRRCDFDAFSGSEEEGEWCAYSSSFCDYINVDDIAAVYVDGTELMLK